VRQLGIQNSTPVLRALSPPPRTAQTALSPRRLLAVVLPQLLCELAQRQQTSPSTRGAPRAIVLVDALSGELDGRAELDAVNPAAHQLGIRPRQLLRHARTSIECLMVQPLLRSEVQAALAHLAEMLLRFGSPVSFRAPDTIWVDITGSSHLFASEHELALELIAQIRSQGHAARVAIAPGPWLARAFAHHLQPDRTGILQVSERQSTRFVGDLPIIALPIQMEAVTWFARLGLLNIADLKNLPPSSLAARLEGQVAEGSVGDVLELLQGRDTGILTAHQPEEAPREELFWEDPVTGSEALLFVLKGLAARLSARLDGRGQAARELLLTLHYDRSIAALTTPEGHTAPPTKTLSFKLATPLFHADDLERVMRLRLQRQKLLAPTLGLSLQASAVTGAHHCQMDLSETAAWRCGISTDARALTVLLAELSGDIGAESVGRLITQDSHLLEKSSRLQPISADEPAETNVAIAERARYTAAAYELSAAEATAEEKDLLSEPTDFFSMSADELTLPQLPTRLLHPAIEIHAPIRKDELWVIGEQAFIVRDIRFEQRLEGIEWWDHNRVFRDYFRVWIERAGARIASTHWHAARRGHGASQLQGDISGLEALVYRDRERGKSYLHALYD
jgi:protein ImuB